MTRDIGTLQAYLDGALASGEQADVAAHLASCETCHRQLETLRANAVQSNMLLTSLEPVPMVVPAAPGCTGPDARRTASDARFLAGSLATEVE